MHPGPNLAFALSASGVLLIYVELVRPGTLVPGLTGAALLTWSAFELSRYPIHLPALLPIAAGLLLLLAEILWNTRLAAPVLGTLAIAFGSVHLVTGSPRLSTYIAIPVSVTFGAVSSLLAISARRARQNKRIDLAA